MNGPDMQAAVDHARKRLERELSPLLLYHNLPHTFDDVLPATINFARMSRVNGQDLDLLIVAAAYHDIGWIIRGKEHEAISVQIVQQTLPSYGFDQQQILKIAGMIMATRLPQTPGNLLEKIVADADLDVLGREDFWPRNQHLRDEMANRGMPMSDIEWFESQLRFLHAHQYFTEAARTLRGKDKALFVAEMEQRIAELKAKHKEAVETPDINGNG